MLGVHARSVAIGSLIVVISMGRLEAAQNVSGPYEEAINRALVLLPSGQRRSSSSMPRRRPGPSTLTDGESRRSSGTAKTSST
jgi:hypothetical protein